MSAEQIDRIDEQVEQMSNASRLICDAIGLYGHGGRNTAYNTSMAEPCEQLEEIISQNAQMLELLTQQNDAVYAFVTSHSAHRAEEPPGRTLWTLSGRPEHENM